MSSSITVAAVCMECRPEDVEGNLAAMERLAARAASAGASLVCFPELSDTGYPRGGADAMAAAGFSEAISRRLLEIAAAHRCTLIAGLVEPGDKGGHHISHLVASPEGAAGRHRKTHLPPPESGIYRAASGLDLFREGPVSYGIQLCYESHFPELSTLNFLLRRRPSMYRGLTGRPRTGASHSAESSSSCSGERIVSTAHGQ